MGSTQLKARTSREATTANEPSAEQCRSAIQGHYNRWRGRDRIQGVHGVYVQGETPQPQRVEENDVLDEQCPAGQVRQEILGQHGLRVRGREKLQELGRQVRRRRPGTPPEGRQIVRDYNVAVRPKILVLPEVSARDTTPKGEKQN